HRLFGDALEVEVDGEAQVMARRSKLLAFYADLLPVAVDDDVARAIDAAQPPVIGLFHARLAHHVTGLKVVIAAALEVLLRDLADIPDQVRREAIARVKPALLVHGHQLGQLIAMRLNESLLIGSDVLLERDLLVLRL